VKEEQLEYLKERFDELEEKIDHLNDPISYDIEAFKEWRGF
jgi:hypothetical protein